MLDKLPLRSSTYEKYEKIGIEIAEKLGNYPLQNIWKEIAKTTFFDVAIPQANYNSSDVLDCIMGFASGCQDKGLLLSLGAHCFAVGAVFKKYFTSTELDGLRSGEIITAFAATEEEAGSDVMAMQTTFEEKEGNYSISGEKCYITNATIANEFIIFATKDKRLYSRGISAFRVGKHLDGLKVSAQIASGLKNAAVGKIHCNNALVSNSSRIGKINQGAEIFHHAILYERILLQASQIGLMRKHLELSIEYVNKRKQFNKSIGSNQLVLNHIVSMYKNYFTSLALIEKTTENLFSGTINEAEACLTKLYISEAALNVHIDAMRIFAGNDYIQNKFFSSTLLDTFGGTIYSGTSDLQKIVIGSALGILH